MVAEIKAGSVHELPQTWGFRDELVPEILEKVRALRPLLRKNAAAGEAQRSPTDEVIKAIDELGIWWMIVPRRWGGLGLSATAMAQINAELAKGDPSVAWVSQILNGTTWVGTLGSDALQEELYGNGRPRICSAVTPPGTAQPVEGGYLVSGRWPYCSGSRQAKWAMMGVLRLNADGTKSPGCLTYLPMSEVTIEDTWYSVGMQGTGSDTIVAKDVFVPSHMFVPIEKSFNQHEAGKRHLGEPADYYSLVTLVRSTGMGLVVGAAEAMLEIVLEGAKTRGVVTTTYAKQTDSQVFLHDVGEAATKIRTARRLIEGTTRAIDAAALERRPLPPAERSELKADSALANELIVAAAEQLMFLSGSSAFFLTNDLSRFWRDINVAARHVTNLPNIGYELHGRGLLGMPNIILGEAY
jgi:3-hydroxy-9,10-secoandrosta-1,3,5(10)-triene-9,17-dione monooxygenase